MSDDNIELEGFDFGDGSDFDFGVQEQSTLMQDFEAQDVQQNPSQLQPSSQPQPKQQPQAQPNQQPQQQSQPQRVERQGQNQHQPQKRRPPQGQNVVQVMGSVDRERVKAQQRVNRPRPSNMQNQQMQQNVRQPQIQQNQPVAQPNLPKKKSKLPLVLVPLLLVGGAVGFFAMKCGEQVTPQVEDYQQTGRYAYDNLLTALKSYDALQVDAMVGTTTGDSYLAQEWSYANNNKIRQDFIVSVCANVNFEYPSVNQLGTSGEEITVTHVDYTSLSATMNEDREAILELYKKSGISEKDYDYEDKMTDLMLDYIVSKGNLPVTSSQVVLGVSFGAVPVISNDTELDKLLFSSDEFHIMCDTFSQVATGFTGYETEKYTVKEEQPNPEYNQWKIRFDSYYEADGGRFIKGVSKWEPWYLRDGNNNYILDENGEKIVNYYTVKDDNGNDWIQPSQTVIVDVEKERQVEVEWVEDSVVPYCFMGAYYCQNEYDGSFSSDVRVGDGSIEHTAGVGTPIITKCLGTDGEYHDIKITMTGYWKGQDAINYAVSFSEKNRGFDINSVIQLICYEIKIENLENKAFTFKSDMFLSDKNSNKSARTGTMYGFYESATVEAGDSVIINDWATSTELEQKYVCWGSSFNRVYDVVYFKVLAGEGDVPTYSAYKAFTGDSEVINIGS